MSSHNNPPEENGPASDKAAPTRKHSSLGQNTYAFRPGNGADNRIDLDNIYGVLNDTPPDFSPIKDNITAATTQFLDAIEPTLTNAKREIEIIIMRASERQLAEIAHQKLAAPSPLPFMWNYNLEEREKRLNAFEESIKTSKPPTFIGSHDELLSNAIEIAQGTWESEFYEDCLNHHDLGKFLHSADAHLLTILSIDNFHHLVEDDHGALHGAIKQETTKEISAILAPIKKQLLAYGEKIHDAAGGHELNHLIIPYYSRSRAVFMNNLSNNLDRQIASLTEAFEEHAKLSAHIKPYVSPEEVRQVELNHNALYMRTLTNLLRERGYKATPEQLFHGTKPSGIYGSQLLLHVRNFDGPDSNLLGAFDNESTTPYRFDFNFVEMPVGSDGESIMAPTMAFDSKAINFLKNSGVSHAMLRTHMHNHLKMAMLAEHDGSAHQVILPHPQKVNFHTPVYTVDQLREMAPQGTAEEEIQQALELQRPKKTEPFLKGKPLPLVQTETYVEDHALALHTQILKRLFEESPKRKDLVLKYATEAYLHIGEIQKIALKQATTAEEVFRANEAATYLAETYTHRLARVISFEDPDLHKKLSITMPDKTVEHMSVSDAADRLMNVQTGQAVITPNRLLPLPKGGVLTILEHHTSEAVGKGTYRAIYNLNRFPMVVSEMRPLNEQERQEFIERMREYRNFDHEDNLTQFVPKEIQAIKEIKFLDPLDAVAETRGLKKDFKRRVKDALIKKPLPEDGYHPSPHENALSHGNAGSGLESGVGNGIGMAMGAYGLYNKLGDQHSAFHQDMQSHDKLRKAAAVAGVTTDVAMVGTNGAAAVHDVQVLRAAQAANRSAQMAAKTAEEAAKASEKILLEAAKKASEELAKHGGDIIKDGGTIIEGMAAGAEGAAVGGGWVVASKFAGRMAIPLALAVGTFETGAAMREGNRERAAGAIGSTGGGIIAGIGAGVVYGAIAGGSGGTAVVPGVGTLVGGVVVGVVGGVTGAFLGEAAMKKWGTGFTGWMTGVDGKFEEALKGIDPRLIAYLDSTRNHKVDVEELHTLLKRIDKDSIDKLDTDKNGTLTAKELNQSLTAALVRENLNVLLPALEKLGVGKAISNKNGHLTADEIKAAFPKGFDFLSLDKEHNGISAKEIVDGLVAHRPAMNAAAHKNQTTHQK